MIESLADLMRQFNRSDRLNQQILRDISQLLEQELSELGGGLTTFTAVRLSKDLRYASVYYSFLGKDDDRRRVEEYFQRERGRIRSEVGKGLKMRHIPEFTFKFDPTIEQGIRIEQLLNEIKSDQQEQ
jgi:ribosome-binding factor A